MIFLIKSQDKEVAFRGEVTAFLALLFILMLSLVGALIESVSFQMNKNRKRADTLLALESVFAEYDKELLEEYDLFVHIGTAADVLNNRLEYYGATNMTHSVLKMELLTDENGQAFYEQAVRYAKDWLGMDDTFYETEYESGMEFFPEEEESMVMEDLENLLNQEGAELPEDGNPLSAIQNLKNRNLLTLVAENPAELSNRSITTEKLPSKRELKEGNYGITQSFDAADKLFFVAYAAEHFRDYSDKNDSRTLCYEEEYLIGGYGSDKENLEKVCENILSIRMAINYVYLQTDSAKQAEAEVLAATLCGLLEIPGITQVVKQAILIAWAYGESIVDVRVLLKGNKVPFIKTSETWQLKLSNLIYLGTSQEVVEEMKSPVGMSYQDYLNGLLMLDSEETLSMRSLDLIESNLQKQTDECMTKIQIESYAEYRRNVTDTFRTSYGYQ